MTFKVKLISIIVSVIILLSALGGVSAYLIVRETNNTTATIQEPDSSIGNLYNTDGTLNESNISKLLEKIGYTGSSISTSRNAQQIASTAGTGTAFVFEMGYYVDTSGNLDPSKPLEWEAVYLWDDYLTIWLTRPYTDYYFNSSSGATANYSNSQLRTVTNNVYTLLTYGLTSFDGLVDSPSSANATWQAAQGNAYYSSNSNWSITNGLQSSSTGSNGGTSDKSDRNPYDWSWDSSVYNDKFWIPSHYEVCNVDTSNETSTTTNGLWQIADNRFNDVAYAGGSGSGLCWLRSGVSNDENSALALIRIILAGPDFDPSQPLPEPDVNVVTATVNGAIGVRPAAHISLEALSNLYDITVSANNSSYGSVLGGGTYAQGASCTLIANSNSGYMFTGWSTNGGQTIISTANPYTFTVSSSQTYTAVFERSTFNISYGVNNSNYGTATGSSSGSTITLTATANPGCVFLGWSTDSGESILTTANPYTFTPTADGTYIAMFRMYSATLRYDSNQGTASGTVSGTSYTFTATPNTGYAFVGWSTDGGSNIVSNANPYTFTPTADATYTAMFTTLPYTITVQANNSSFGTVSGGGECNYNSIQTIRATPNPGYRFVRWELDGEQVSTNPNYSFIVKNEATYIAIFEPVSYIITAQANDDDYGLVTGGGNYDYNESCVIEATANTGYTFIGWSTNGGSTITSTTNPLTIKVTSSATYTAVFEPIPYTITVQASPTIGGAVSGGGIYATGTRVSIVATASDEYYFVRWELNNSQVSTSATYTFTVSNDATYTAIFAINPLITVATNDASYGTVSGGGRYTPNSRITITATANPGHNFVGWQRDGAQVSTSRSYTITVPTNDTTYTAIFERIVYTVSATTATPNLGSISISPASGPYYYGDTVTITGTPTNANYTLSYLIVNQVRHTTGGNTYEITIQENTSITAYFSGIDCNLTISANDYAQGTVFYNGTLATSASPISVNVSYGETPIIIAVASANATEVFSHWEINAEGDIITSSSNPLNWEVVNNATITAVFSNSVTDTVAVDATYGGSAEIVGDAYDSITGETEIILVARVKVDNYRFVGWFIGDSETAVSTDTSVRLAYSQIQGQVVTARFELIDDSHFNDDKDSGNGGVW